MADPTFSWRSISTLALDDGGRGEGFPGHRRLHMVPPVPAAVAAVGMVIQGWLRSLHRWLAPKKSDACSEPFGERPVY